MRRVKPNFPGREDPVEPPVSSRQIVNDPGWEAAGVKGRQGSAGRPEPPGVPGAPFEAPHLNQNRGAATLRAAITTPLG